MIDNTQKNSPKKIIHLIENQKGILLVTNKTSQQVVPVKK